MNLVLVLGLYCCLFADNVIFATKHYIPIVFIHGINHIPRDWNVVTETIKKSRESKSRGRLIELHSPFDGIPGSWISLREQLAWFQTEIKVLIDLSPEEFRLGFDLVCHSQGAVACRALIQDTDNLKVRSFISLAGPHCGVYGEMWLSFLPPKWRDLTLHNAWEVAYEKWAQETLSPANLWNDPFHQNEFLLKNLFLPEFLGLVGTPQEIERRKKNFVSLSKANFLVGNFTQQSFDLGIDPWISGAFGFYDSNGKLNDVWSQNFFIDDTIGLRTLHETGRLHFETPLNIAHDDWIYNSEVIRQYIIPLLTPHTNDDELAEPAVQQI